MARARIAFVFEDWAALAESDPAAFEEKRRSVLREAIDRAPEPYRPRLSSLQWRVDRERERSSSPISACVKISEMMWSRVYGDNGLINALSGSAISHGYSPVGADIVPFPKPE